MDDFTSVSCAPPGRPFKSMTPNIRRYLKSLDTKKNYLLFLWIFFSLLKFLERNLRTQATSRRRLLELIARDKRVMSAFPNAFLPRESTLNIIDASTVGLVLVFKSRVTTFDHLYPL